MSSDAITLGELSDSLQKKADSTEEVSVGDLMEVAGHRGTALFILIPALIGASPVGMIPVVPTLMAMIVAFFAVQIAMGRDQMWLPDILKNRAVDDDRFKSAVEKIEPILRRLDGWFGQRLEWLTGEVSLRLAAGIVVALSLTVPPLELLPGAALAPLGAIAIYGLALSMKDGILMLVAFTATAGVIWLGLTAL
ncbi:MAG: exopolysaccharide biosynthesis protein [Silicimonas sp.]|nr:exopolysaccharide biosynthesis protein [Silicimonas sp.]